MGAGTQVSGMGQSRVGPPPDTFSQSQKDQARNWGLSSLAAPSCVFGGWLACAWHVSMCLACSWHV